MCNTNKRTPHKHADLIKVWADGRTIQYRDSSGCWRDWTNTECLPSFTPWGDYRIKPEQPDLEKYGVEVGDLWLLEEANLFSNALITDVAGDRCTLTVIGSGSSVVWRYQGSLLAHGDLVFRRGVVNKL